MFVDCRIRVAVDLENPLSCVVVLPFAAARLLRRCGCHYDVFRAALCLRKRVNGKIEAQVTVKEVRGAGNGLI